MKINCSVCQNVHELDDPTREDYHLAWLLRALREAAQKDEAEPKTIEMPAVFNVAQLVRYGPSGDPLTWGDGALDPPTMPDPEPEEPVLAVAEAPAVYDMPRVFENV